MNEKSAWWVNQIERMQKVSRRKSKVTSKRVIIDIYHQENLNFGGSNIGCQCLWGIKHDVKLLVEAKPEVSRKEIEFITNLKKKDLKI
jgi:hypothetical protein